MSCLDHLRVKKGKEKMIKRVEKGFVWMEEL